MTAPDFLDPRLTEQRNPRTERIDVAATLEIVDLINAEDATVPAAVRAVRAEIARAIDLVVDALRQGGRLIYVGAGTHRAGSACWTRASVHRPSARRRRWSWA